MTCDSLGPGVQGDCQLHSKFKASPLHEALSLKNVFCLRPYRYNVNLPHCLLGLVCSLCPVFSFPVFSFRSSHTKNPLTPKARTFMQDDSVGVERRLAALAVDLSLVLSQWKVASLPAPLPTTVAQRSLWSPSQASLVSLLLPVWSEVPTRFCLSSHLALPHFCCFCGKRSHRWHQTETSLGPEQPH